MIKEKKIEIAHALIISSILLPLMGFIASHLRLFHATGLMLLPSGSYTLIPALLLLSSGLVLCKFNLKDLNQSQLITLPALYLLLILFLSDWISRNESLFRGPTIRGEILILGILIATITVAKFRYTFHYILFFAIPILIFNFINALHGQQIFSDDHATFFYRLSTLLEVFPNIPFYNPLWNAGTDERAFFATGSLNIFFLSFPFLKIFGVAKTYNYIIAALAYVLPSISIYSSAIIMQTTKRIAVIASIICLAFTLNWYQWLFTYGTLGFTTSVCIIPIIFAYLVKCLDSERVLSIFDALLIVLLTTLMLFWSASVIVFLPLFCLSILKIKTLVVKKWVAVIFLLLLTVNLPWVYAFWKVSHVGNFVNNTQTKLVSEAESNLTPVSFESNNKENPTPELAKKELITAKATPRKYKHRPGNIDFKKSLASFRKNTQSTNPIILLLCIPGILLLPKSMRLAFTLTCSWLIILSTVLYPLKPQLELDRMFLIAIFILCIPTATAINILLKNLESDNSLRNKILWLIPGVVCLGYLGLTPFNAGAFALKRTGYGYTTKGEFADNINEFIKKRAKAGRIIFSGCVIHDLDGGHISPLSIYNNQAFVASSQVGNLWWYTDVFPSNYLKDGDLGKERYLDLFNVSGVFAHESKLKSYYDENANYKKVWEAGDFNFYERLNFEDNYFIKGSGKILSQNNYGLNLSLESSSAVIKFRYFPFLKAGNCTIKPYQIDSEIQFIELSECEINAPIRLESQKLVNRLKHEK